MSRLLVATNGGFVSLIHTELRLGDLMLKTSVSVIASLSCILAGCTSNQKKTAEAQKIVESRHRLKLQDIKLKADELLVCGSVEHAKGNQQGAKGLQIESKRLNEDDVAIRLIEGKGEVAIFSYSGPIQELGLYTLKGQEDEETVKIEIQYLKEEGQLSLEGVTVGTAYDATPFILECVNDAKEAFTQTDDDKED